MPGNPHPIIAFTSGPSTRDTLTTTTRGLSSFNKTRVQDGRCSPPNANANASATIVTRPAAFYIARTHRSRSKKPRLFLSLPSDVCGGDVTAGGGRGLFARDRCDHKVAASQLKGSVSCASRNRCVSEWKRSCLSGLPRKKKDTP